MLKDKKFSFNEKKNYILKNITDACNRKKTMNFLIEMAPMTVFAESNEKAIW